MTKNLGIIILAEQSFRNPWGGEVFLRVIKIVIHKKMKGGKLSETHLIF